MKNIIWIMMNLLIPVVGPMLLLGLITPIRGFGVAKQLIKESVDDGQLYWSTIALSAAAIYEAIDAFQEDRGAPLYLGLMISICVLIALVASIIVMLATLDSYNQNATNSTDSTEARRNGTGSAVSNLAKVSYWLTLAVVVCSGLQHIFLCQSSRVPLLSEAVTLGVRSGS
ncbi:hypothetical protein [Bordetella sp. LUAb4]|uniref:hypothetical protein n=1 Tax=Bordetella sp. LUAb4 TaxID=2843195 RepID=UPI001E38A729|nr:hypothetical protein [Bordetella sp. LUAb4]